MGAPGWPESCIRAPPGGLVNTSYSAYNCATFFLMLPQVNVENGQHSGWPQALSYFSLTDVKAFRTISTSHTSHELVQERSRRAHPQLMAVIRSLCIIKVQLLPLHPSDEVQLQSI